MEDLTPEQEDWMMKPSFANATILEQGLPFEMGGEAALIWEDILGSSQFPRFVSTIGVDCVSQALLAARRILQLEKLYTMPGGSQWPTLLVLLCECYFLLNDNRGARMMAEEAQALVGAGDDEILDNCVAVLRAFEYFDMHYQNDEGEEDADRVVTYERPPEYQLSSQPSNLVDLQMRWCVLQQLHDGVEQFARFPRFAVMGVPWYCPTRS